MLRRVHIRNFKSVADCEFELGRVNVIIGENGCGKTNLLEALAFAGAGASGKIDNEFLAGRGIRVTDANWMRSAFANGGKNPILVDFVNGDRSSVSLSIHRPVRRRLSAVASRERRKSTRTIEAGRRVIDRERSADH